MTVSYKIIQDFRTITHDMLVAYRQYLLLLVIFCAQYTYSNSSSAPSTDALFSATTAAAYQDLIREQNNGAKAADLDQITKLAEAAREANNSVTAMTTILQNMPAILQQINSPQIQQVTALALSLHGIEIAKSLLSQAKDQGDNVSEARITFEIAKYRANEAHWPEVARLLKNATIIESLAKEDADEAN